MSRIKILNSSLMEQGTIHDVTDAALLERLNSDKLLDFKVPLSAEVNALIVEGNVAEAGGDYYDITEYKKGQDSSAPGQITASVECEHVSYRLNDSDYNLDFFTQTGTPTEILTELLDGTGFTVGTVDFTESVTYSALEAKSRRQLLMEFVALLGGEISYNKFEISILAQRGSTTPKNLLSGRNIDILSKTYSKRDKDADGNPLVSYACDLIRPMAIALGDVVTIDYATLDIDTELRVVSLQTNPYNQYEAGFEIGNFNPGLADDAYRIETMALLKSKTYYGSRIGPEYGFESIRSDMMARGVFNAELFALQSGDGEGGWTNKLYFDPVTGTYIFDGTLSATVLQAIQANIEVIITNTLIAQTLAAATGTIAELTVDRLDTSKKVAKYLESSIANIELITIQDGEFKQIVATTDGTETEQATDRHGAALYWTDETHVGTTTEETDYPVMIYVYEELVKQMMGPEYDAEAEAYIPKLIMGAGSGVPDHPDYGKGYLYKGLTGLYIEYKHSVTGESRIIKLTDDGIDLTQFSAIQFAETVLITGVPQIWVQDEEPAGAKEKDVWADTDDYTRYDKTHMTTGGTLLVSANEFITADGTFTITLHEATIAGIVKLICNVGTGIITLAGTIDGKTDMLLFPGEGVKLITDGAAWRCL